MKTSAFYIISDKYFDKFCEFGCVFKNNKKESRPIYCCIPDKIINGLYWAIPTGTLDERKKKNIQFYLDLDETDVRSNYYHIARTNREAIFYISCVFPVTDQYIKREYTFCGKHLELKSENTQKQILKKLLKILTYENHFPNKLQVKITLIKNILIKEML